MVTWDDFEKIWASASPLTPYDFLDSNYETGWNFVGATPPARQMWDAIQKKNDEKFKFLRDNFGTPNMVTTAAEMTDTDKIYVYVGSEAGWNNGHWYYYDAGTSTWVDGGVYNSTAFVTDTTLTEAGKAADAKAVGDALALKADLAGATFTGNVAVNADFSTTGNATVANDLTVSGATTLTGNVTAGADITASGDIAADDVTANGNLSVVGNATLNGTSTAVTPAVDDNSTKVATTAYVQTEIKPIETDVTINDKRITNIEKLLQGNLYDYDTDDDTAYTKSVPSGAMPYAGLEQIGGKTLAWNQLMPALSSAYTSGSYAPNNGQKVYAGHKYLFMYMGELAENGYIRCYTRLVGGTTNNVWCNIRYPYTYAFDECTADGVGNGLANNSGSFWIYGGAGSNITQFQLFDLTLMFGAGNEPTTIEQFRAMFPNTSYGLNLGTLLSAGLTSVVSKDSNNVTLQTISIPAEIQALEGYGWSAGDVYNYIDLERKVFVKNVARVDLGTQTWNYSTYSGVSYFRADISDMKLSSKNNVCSAYINSKVGSTVNLPDKSTMTAGQQFRVRDDSYTNATAFASAMSGVYLYYEIATPVETDISQYLTNDNLIQVEAGGTLTFENQHGDDYLLPVPSDVTYMIDLQEAINNG